MPFFGGGSGGSGGGTTYPALSGSGAPGSSLGNDGQLYIDEDTNTLYGPKSSGSWGSGIVLTGAAWDEITSKPATFTPATHSHAISDITSLQTTLDGKASSSHSHAISDVTDLQTTLDGKAASTHSHAIADVTDLQTTLDAKATSEGLATEISNLISGAPDSLNTLNELAAAINDDATYHSTVTTLLSGKSDTTHGHAIESLTNVTGVPGTDQILKYDGTNWAMADLEDPANTLGGLTDVSTVTPTTDYFLKWDGGQWSPSPITVDYSTSSGNLVVSPFTGILEVRGVSASDGVLQLNCSNNTHAVKIQAPPHSAAAAYTLTLPDDTGSSGQVLQTDGSGALSWLTIGGSSSVTYTSVPTTETSTGTTGELALDTLHLYVCVATNTWRRIPLETFSGTTGGGGGSTTGIFITTQPSGGYAQNGELTLSLLATVPSPSTITYQWQKYNTTSTAWDNVTGGVYSSLSLSGLTTSNDGEKYRCYLTSSGHSDVISNEATINVASGGIQNVTSTAPTLVFDRAESNKNSPHGSNWSLPFSGGIWKATGKNWTYPGWTLLYEEVEWEYSHDNLLTTKTKSGTITSTATRTGDWNYYLVGVPPAQSTKDNATNVLRNEIRSNADFILKEDNATFISYPPNVEDLPEGSDITNSTFGRQYFTSWADTISDVGKWNRSARVRTRVVLTRTVNGVEEQATSNWSEPSEWRSDPAGNVISSVTPTAFTSHPTATGTLTYTPDPSENHFAFSVAAAIAGTNKRYHWVRENASGDLDFDIIGTIGNEIVDTVPTVSTDTFTGPIYYPKFPQVGEHTIKCMGAADWNKATLSNGVTMTIKSTSDSVAKLLTMTGSVEYMTGRGKSYCKIGGTFGLEGNATFSDEYFENLTFIGGMATGYPNQTADNVSSNSGTPGESGVQFRIEVSEDYGATSGSASWTPYTDNFHNGFPFEDISGAGLACPQMTNLNNQLSFRFSYRFENVNLSLNGTTYSGVTTIWSDWLY